MTHISNTFKKASILLVLLYISASSILLAQEAKEYQFRHKGIDRTYWLYIPETLSEKAPLVIVMHGYGGKAEGYRPEMMATAKKHGFAVCYPQGAQDLKGKTGWNVGYPAQEGMNTDDLDFICRLAGHLQKKHGLSKENTFCSGMSNGGEMCYLLATFKPGTFTAYASVAGLTMEWAYRKQRPAVPVPFMEVHGTADKTSKWDGDPDNKGGWGEYIAVPQAIAVMSTTAGCTHIESCELPVKRNRITLHRYLGGVEAWKNGPEVEVRLYEIKGGKHSWALQDMDTCEEIWNFFQIYLR